MKNTNSSFGTSELKQLLSDSKNTTATDATAEASAAAASTATTTTEAVSIQTKLVTKRDESLDSKVTARLEAYKSAPAVKDKVYNLVEVIKIVVTYPTKAVLDSILTFFKTNKDESFLSETNALQGIQTVNVTYMNKIRILYDVMVKLATNEASSDTINIGVVRNIFKDDFANWVAFKMAKTKRRN